MVGVGAESLSAHRCRGNLFLAKRFEWVLDAVEIEVPFPAPCLVTRYYRLQPGPDVSAWHR